MSRVTIRPRLVQPDPAPSWEVTGPASVKPATLNFNLVLIVREHGPNRIDEIDDEVKSLQDKLDKLVAERRQIQKLISALEP